MIIERECFEERCRFCKDGSICDYNCFTILDEGQFLDECLLHIDYRNVLREAMDNPTDSMQVELANNIHDLWKHRFIEEPKEKIDVEYYEEKYMN